ncbi:MAG: glycoside hydrolase [Clostridia bacterium]|nr:glycoside hydrolase [Clostridia bacterium]
MDFCEQMQHRLTDEDLRLLGDIYEPTEVLSPDGDPGFGSLTLLPDGRIRVYGHYGKRDVFDDSYHRSYHESTDGGLSWKRHIVSDPDLLGSSAYLPYYDLYLAAVRENGQLTVQIADTPDSPVKKKIPLGDFFESTAILAVSSVPGRVLIAAHEHRPDRHPTAFFQVIFVTDDLENFRLIHIEEAPFDKPTKAGVGIRWQQNCREGTLIEKGDGTISLLCRTATDYIYESVSTDGGNTFGGVHPTPLHTVGTMPKYLKLRDGRLLLFFCNTRPLPELPEADGVWEDVFTNRDAAHVAISEDDGKTWFGFREIRLNPLRCAADFRSAGGITDCRDKSMHQFEAAELPAGKVLIVHGQHAVCRRGLIFDPGWLYETDRTETFNRGLCNLSTQVYIRSILGGNEAHNSEELKKYVGHCAYNRENGVRLLPSPLEDGTEALYVAPSVSPFTISPATGAVWNFPMAKRGEATLDLHVGGAGLRVSLLDHWRNPSDETVADEAPISLLLTIDAENEAADAPFFKTVRVKFDLDAGTAELIDRESVTKLSLSSVPPFGLCYLHLQSVGDRGAEGSYIRSLGFHRGN